MYSALRYDKSYAHSPHCTAVHAARTAGSTFKRGYSYRGALNVFVNMLARQIGTTVLLYNYVTLNFQFFEDGAI